MKRKRSFAKPKPPKKPQVAAAECATYAFLNDKGHSHWDGNNGVDFIAETETAHAATNTNPHSARQEDEGFLANMESGDSIPNSNILKNFANFAAKVSGAVNSSNVEPNNKSLAVHGDEVLGRESRVSHLDPLNNEEELKSALSVIKTVMKMNAAQPFNIPVDPTALGIPDYFDIIDTPMDFGTICNNLEWGGKYKNSKDVFNDVQLIWDNCSKYNKKGSYILDLMRRVRINFMKHWNAAGLFREGEEVDYGTHHQDAAARSASKNNDRNVFRSRSKISNSVHQERRDIASLHQIQKQQCSPCISLTQSQNLPSQFQGGRQLSDFQSSHSQRSGYHAMTDCTKGHYVHVHKHQGGQSGTNNSGLQDQIMPHKEIYHQPSPSCGSKHHPNERPFMGQSHSSHHHSIKPTAPNSESEGHFHLPFHGASSSPACKTCEHACTLVPRNSNASNHKHHETCSCHYHELQPLPRCGDQYQQHYRPCHPNLNSRDMLTTDLYARDNVEEEPNTTRGGFGYLTASARSCRSHQQQRLSGCSELPESSMFHKNSYRWSSQAQLDVGSPETHQPQDLANTGHAEDYSHVPVPAESTVRHASCQNSGSPVTGDSSNHEVCDMGPSGSQSPSLELSNKPKENDKPDHASPSTPAPSGPQGDTNITDSTKVVKKNQVRGPTRCLKFLNAGKPISITTNELGQPVGPNAPKLISFLGTLARNGHMAPLTCVNWKAIPEENKENMWQEVQKTFEIDPTSKHWVIKNLSIKWKSWKSILKTKHYITHATDEERLADRDERVLPDQWAYLVSYWSSEEAEKRSARNKANRAKVKFGHATGTKSFARIREEQRAKRPDGKAPSPGELFILTRTRKDGKPVNEATSAVITQLRGITNQQADADQTTGPEDDAFSKIIGRDPHGRVRCKELAPTSCEFGRGAPSKAAAMKMVTEANSEVREMKERLVSMEQTCAQMAQQMATMMSMMASMQKDTNVPPQVNAGCATEEGSPEKPRQSTSLRRSSRKRNI
ncbi:OLC1v1016141C1 [Oldenlandia corymbosa var. corymbosa]|uniref:OLC1v1016141C1 n=1 Tax=Oldenlandia corymbosa var. corymbosa TaxID=529605 RepID=A0AAV1E6R2_OLDCO|nr:OLC1v1016141C1 [Oldenlandia corymbosa var. corymbosa]